MWTQIILMKKILIHVLIPVPILIPNFFCVFSLPEATTFFSFSTKWVFDFIESVNGLIPRIFILINHIQKGMVAGEVP